MPVRPLDVLLRITLLIGIGIVAGVIALLLVG